ncbi:MAG: radical SAM protein [Spirochaetes bacterium]|nr:radical SAM protein [Spirochaetota bacterium]
MLPSKKYDASLIQGMFRVLQIWTKFKPVRLARLWKRYRIFKKANRIRMKLFSSESLTIPPVIILSITMKCNLSCAGCYSRDYSLKDEMSLGQVESLFKQAEEMGIAFVVITGGEPLLRKGLVDLLARHPKLVFFLFTNGYHINSTWVNNIKHLDHIIPILSVEGDERDTDERRGKGVHRQVIMSMNHLKKAGIFFGFSVMITRKNFRTIGDDAFIDTMIEQGCKIGYYVGYVPSAKDADKKLVPTAQEQKWFRSRINNFRGNKRIILIHMPDDEYELGGVCMAAGRGFVHVNAQGYVEPCPFAHLATDSVRTTSLKEVFQSAFFKHIREDSKLLARPKMGCALFEHKEELAKIGTQFSAKPTD